MAQYILLISIFLFMHLNKSHGWNSVSQSEIQPCNQSLINTTSMQTPTSTLEARTPNASATAIPTNHTNNIPYSSNSTANSSDYNSQISDYNPQSRRITLFTLIGSAVFITAIILIIRARYGLCKRMKSNISKSIKNHIDSKNQRRPQIQHHVSAQSQNGVAHNGASVSDGSGDAGQGTPQSHSSGNGLDHVKDPPAIQIRLSIADSVNKVYHKSPKTPDSMKRRIKEYIQRELNDNEIAGYGSRLSVASAVSPNGGHGHGHQWKIPLGMGHNHKSSMEQQISGKDGEHTHTKSKSMEIGYHLSGQKINALQEDEEIDVFDVRQPGSPCIKSESSDHVLMNQNASKPQIGTTDGIGNDEFVVDGGESSHDIVTRGEDYDHPGHDSNDSDMAGSHDSDNDIILDMDMNTKGFIE